MRKRSPEMSAAIYLHIAQTDVTDWRMANVEAWVLAQLERIRSEVRKRK